MLLSDAETKTIVEAKWKYAKRVFANSSYFNATKLANLFVFYAIFWAYFFVARFSICFNFLEKKFSNHKSENLSLAVQSSACIMREKISKMQILAGFIIFFRQLLVIIIFFNCCCRQVCVFILQNISVIHSILSCKNIFLCLKSLAKE